jgi:hypothetical protein
MIIKQLTVFLENKSGRLSEVTKALFDQNINISALSIADTAEYGLLRMIVSNPDLAQKMLKEKGFAVNATDVIGIVVPDQPGGLHRAIEILANENISIEYLYAFSRNQDATVVIRTSNIQNTIDVLLKNSIKLIKASDLYNL